MRIGIVGCSKIKLKNAAAAKDLYTSRYFKTSFAWASKFTDKVFIVSSKYGLLHPDKVIQPYDYTFSKSVKTASGPIPKEVINAWGARAASQLRLILRPGDELIFLAGKEYFEPIIRSIGPVKWQAPFKHFGIGSRAHLMQQQLKGAIHE